MTPKQRAALGAAITRRRLALGLSVSEAARRAGVSRPTWTGAESGERQTEAVTAARIERTLAWAPGSIDAILAGGEPAELPTTTEPPRRREPSAPAFTPEEKARLDAEIARIDGMALPEAAKLTMLEALLRRWEAYARERAAQQQPGESSSA